MFNVLMSNISRFSFFCQGTLDLLHYLISNFDFNEFFVFRVELDAQIDNLILKQKQLLLFPTLSPTKSISSGSTVNNANVKVSKYIWPFRQQLIYSVLNFCECGVDPTNVIFSLLCYTPGSIYKKFLIEQINKQNFSLVKFLKF